MEWLNDEDELLHSFILKYCNGELTIEETLAAIKNELAEHDNEVQTLKSLKP